MVFFRKRRRKKTKKSLFKFRRRTVKQKPKIDLSTQNLLRPKYKKKVNAFIYHLSIIIVILGFGYLILFSPLFIVEEISILGSKNISGNGIEKIILNQTAGKYLNFISKRHFIFIKEGNIKKEILNQYKNIEKVKLEKKAPGKLLVTIWKKETQVVICGIHECVFLDKEGKAISKGTGADLYQYEDVIEVVKNESNNIIEIGEGVNTLEYLEFVKNIKENFKNAIGIEAKEIFTPLPSASEIKIKTGKGWLVLFDTKNSVISQLDALKVTLEKEIKPEDRICIEYIDLRIPNKVYYKIVDDCDVVKKEQKKNEEQKNHKDE